MEIHKIKGADTLALRQRLLRPHLATSECIYPGDDDTTTCHLGAFVDKTLIGIVSVYQKTFPEFNGTCGYQFRALAIIEKMRGKGYGLALLNAAEQYAQLHGAFYIWANARVSAKAYYRKVGYQVGDTEFMVTGVGAHVIVKRDFKPQT